MMNISRVFILASRPLFAEGVQSLLSSQPDMEVVGVATAGPDVFTQAQASAPDVLIVEAKGEKQSHVVAQALEAIPDAKIVSISLEDNCIHTYYQQSKQGRRVEDLLETIREPISLEGRSQKTLRLFVLYQGSYGQRILENIQRHSPGDWIVKSWCAPSNLPLILDDPTSFLPSQLPTADLALSLGESPGAAQLLPSVIEDIGAQAAIAPVDNVSWLPGGLAHQLQTQLTEMGITAVFPKPFCSLTDTCYNVHQQKISFENLWISEFARHFGKPLFRIECDAECQRINKVEVKRGTPCGNAQSIARQLIGVHAQEAITQAGLFHHHYPCLATMRVDPNLGEPLIQAAGNLAKQAVETAISSCSTQDPSDTQKMQ